MPEVAAPAARRRNILFITTDQQRHDSLGCNGGTVARTPVVDRLAAEGINYRRAYNQNTVCMPARSTMLTGQYVRTHGVVANGIPLPVDAPSVAQYLHDAAGYRTALLGKAHFEPGFDPQNRFEENARVARWDTGPWRGFERSEQAMHAAAWGDHPIAHYGRWLKEHHPEHLHSFAGLLQAEPGGDTAAPETKNNPIPRRWYHTDWVADLTVDWLDSLGADEPWFCWMSFPDPHHPWDPPASELSRVPWQDLALPPGHPGSDEAIRAVLARKPAHWLAFWEGTVPQHGGRPGDLRALHAHRRPDPRGQRQGARDERAHRRGLRPRAADGGAAGLAGRHRRRLHHRPRRAAGRLRPPLQGPVPHRRARCGCLSSGGRPLPPASSRRWSPTRSARWTWRRRSAPSPAWTPAPWMQGRVLPHADGEPGRERALCEWDSQFPGYGMHLRSVYRDGWLCTVYEPSTAGQPNGLEEVWGDGVLRPCPVVYEQSTTGPGGVGIATGELYNVDDDPYQFENRWDDPAQRARRDDLVADLYASLPTEVRTLKVMAPA